MEDAAAALAMDPTGVHQRVIDGTVTTDNPINGLRVSNVSPTPIGASVD